MAYITLQGGDLFTDPSYTIRSFYPDTEFRRIDGVDLAYHGTAYGIGTAGGTALIKSVVQEGWVGAPGVTQTFLSGTSNPALDPGTVVYPAAYTQNVLNEYSQYGLGRLEDAASPVSPNADSRYNCGILLEVPSTETKPFNLQSSFDDNLTEGFLANDDEFYIQMPVWDWPGTVATGTVSFSSSLTYEPDQTVSIPFSDTTVLGAGLGAVGNFSTAGDKIWRINRDVLEGHNGGTVDLANIKRVRISLNPGSATYTFKTGPMKVVGESYNYYEANVDTKRGHLIMERWPSTTQYPLPAVIQNGVTAKDCVYVARFHIGAGGLPDPGTVSPGTAASGALVANDESQIPTVTYNELSLYTRVHPDRSAEPFKYLSAKITIDSVKTELAIYEGLNQIEFFYKDGQIPEGDYFLILTTKDDKISAEIRGAEGSFINNLYLETGFYSITDPWLSGSGTAVLGYDAGFGYAGYEFRPVTGDFYLDYVYSKDVALAEYESEVFESNLPVEGATLFAVGIPDAELLPLGDDGLVKVMTADNFYLGKNEVGNLDSDVVISKDSVIKYETESVKVTKTANSYISSVQYQNYFVASDFSRLTLRMKLRYETALDQGDFKVVIWDKTRQNIVYLQQLTGVVPNQWNEIEIPLISNSIFNDEFIFEFGHFGNYAGSYWMENVSLTIDAVEWAASNDGGSTYYPFYTAMNGKYNSINFPSYSFYSAVSNSKPVNFYSFDDINNLAYFNTGTAYVTNQYPYSENNGAVVTTAGTTTFAYPISIPQTLNDTQGNPYTIPKCVQTENRDYCVALYRNSRIEGNTYNTPFSGTALTYSVWFYSDDITTTYTLGQHGTASPTFQMKINSVFDSTISGASLSVSGTAGTAEVAIPAWDDGQWHQATFVHDSDYLRMYYDGELVGAENKATIGFLSSVTGKIVIPGPSVGSAPAPFVLGENENVSVMDTSQPFILINTMLVYSKALTAVQIKNQYLTANSEYNKLRVRAKGYTRNAWISSYEVVPKYAQLGRIIQRPPNTAPVKFDQAIFDYTQFGN